MYFSYNGIRIGVQKARRSGEAGVMPPPSILWGSYVPFSCSWQIPLQERERKEKKVK